MLKYVAITIVFMICTFFGYYFGEKYKDRSNQLKEIQKAMILLNTEVVFSNTAIPQALIKISNAIMDPFANIFQSTAKLLDEGIVMNVSEAFRYSYKENEEYIRLKSNDYRILDDFFKVLGESGVVGQEKIFKITMDSLIASSIEAEKEVSVNTKMYRTLGLCLGLVFAVFFI